MSRKPTLRSETSSLILTRGSEAFAVQKWTSCAARLAVATFIAYSSTTSAQVTVTEAEDLARTIVKMEQALTQNDARTFCNALVYENKPYIEYIERVCKIKNDAEAAEARYRGEKARGNSDCGEMIKKAFHQCMGESISERRQTVSLLKDQLAKVSPDSENLLARARGSSPAPGQVPVPNAAPSTPPPARQTPARPR